MKKRRGIILSAVFIGMLIGMAYSVIHDTGPTPQTSLLFIAIGFAVSWLGSLGLEAAARAARRKQPESTPAPKGDEATDR
jgi:amino acid transporter